MPAIGPLLRREIEITFDVIRSRSSNQELTFICPEPGCNDETGNRSVNLKNGKTSCWRCNIGGSFLAWAKKLGHTFSAEGEYLATLDPRDMLDQTVEKKSILPVVTDIKLPEGFRSCRDNPESVYTRMIGEMAVRKNLEPEDLIEAGVGFTREHPVWERFAIFPVQEYRHTVYYQGRTYAEEPGDTTKRFPTEKEAKYGARYWLYNLDELRTTKAPLAIVVESILNVISLRKYFRQIGYTEGVPVAAFKHRVSAEQFYKLAKLRSVEQVCLLFDHDAIAHAWKDARQFVGRFKISVAEMPAGEDNKRLDPNDDVELAWQCFQTRRPYHAEQRFLSNKGLNTEANESVVSLAGFRFD